MIDYIKGELAVLNPTEAVIECGGLGYSCLISLQTFEKLQGQQQVKVFVHHYLREDEELFYGFATEDERDMFRLLISVSGVGCGSARMMLSSLTTDEVRSAIIGEDISKIKSVKGIGLKTAQRVVVDLRDRVAKGPSADATALFQTGNNAVVDEATTALVMLGFSKAAVGKVIPSILKANPAAKVEDLIKAALQKL